MKMNEKLKPCPLCGGEAEYYEERIYRVPFMNLWWNGVKCVECGCAIVNADKSKCPNDVMKLWNRRVTNEHSDRLSSV